MMACKMIYGILVLELIIGQCMALSTLPPVNQGPQYTIYCLENGSVEVRGAGLKSIVSVLGQGTKCFKNKSLSYTFFTIPKECMSPPNVKADRTVTFTIHDPTFDGGHGSKPRTTLKAFFGGQRLHTITIKCKKLPDRGMKMQVVRGLKLDTETIVRPDEVENIEMYLKTKNNLNRNEVLDLPDISSVYIGDKFYLYLVYLGTEDYSVIPTKCAAYNGAYANEPSASILHVDLWTNTGCLSNYAKDYRIMREFHHGSSNTVTYAEVYGFRFQNVGEVTFVCDVNLCRNTTTSDCSLPSTCSNSWNPRQRRSTEHHGYMSQRKLFKTVHIQNKPGLNRAGLLSSKFYTVLAVLMIQQLMQCK